MLKWENAIKWEKIITKQNILQQVSSALQEEQRALRKHVSKPHWWEASPARGSMLAHSMDPCSPSEEFPHHPLSVSVTLTDWKHERMHSVNTVSPELSSLPANISAPTMVPTPSRQTNTATKWITLYLARRINQERAINTGIPKQSKSCREGKQAASNTTAAWNKEA